jgi:hypothetical protein
VTPLEALAVDYVKAHDNELKTVKALSEHIRKLGPRKPLDVEAVKLSEARNEAGAKTRTLFAAIRSHVHAAYTEELNQ